jgi:hypothetical protein
LLAILIAFRPSTLWLRLLRWTLPQQLLLRRSFAARHPFELLGEPVEPVVNLIERNTRIGGFMIEFPLSFFASFASRVGRTALFTVIAMRRTRGFVCGLFVSRFAVGIARPLFASSASGFRRAALFTIVTTRIAWRFICNFRVIRFAADIARPFFPPFAPRLRRASRFALFPARVLGRFLFGFRFVVEVGEQCRLVFEVVFRLDDVIEPLADRHAGPTRFRACGLPRFRAKAFQIPWTARFHSHAKTCIGIRMCLLERARIGSRRMRRYPVSPAIEI